jgi:hypothetical protein
VKGTLQLYHVDGISKGKVRTMITCYCEQCLNCRYHTPFDECFLIKKAGTYKKKHSEKNESQAEPEGNIQDKKVSETKEQTNQKTNKTQTEELHVDKEHNMQDNILSQTK